jgi:SRSO17 transposase
LDEDTVFANKPELAAPMTGRFPDAGHRVGWVAADEVYGGNPKLRSALEERQVGYVLTVACSHEVTTDAGKFRADALAAKVPKRARQKRPAGAGAKGAPLLRLGRHRPGRIPSRQPPAADPPQPHHR